MVIRLLTPLFWIAAVLALVGANSPAVAQGNPAAALFLSGVSFTDSNDGQTYAYLRLQSQDLDVLRGIKASIYAKLGLPGSAGSFATVGGMLAQFHPNAIASLADKFPSQLLDRPAFEQNITDLFGEFGTAAGIGPAQLLSTVLQIAEADPEVFSRLLMLSYEEPFMAVLLGVGAVIPMPANVMTFELRSAVDGSSGMDLLDNRVIGRVTIDATSPPPLPQPPAPIHLPDPAPTGHLNVKLRWNLTPALLRATPVIFGYDVFRIERSVAEAAGYHVTPPTPAQMAALLQLGAVTARRINEGAVLPIDTADPQQPFIVDDNGAVFGRGLPLRDGDAFYYFIAARDLLGRFGSLSDGTLVTVCARFPTPAPRRVAAQGRRVFESGSADTRMEITWRAHRSAQTQPPHGFHVYRWQSVGEMQSAVDPAFLATRRVSPLIPFVAGKADYRWRDDGPDAPSLPDDAGQTFWYSVRAVLETACGQLESGDSAPAWGVLRDFRGPENAALVISLTDSRPSFLFSDPPNVQIPANADALFSGPSGNIQYFSLFVMRAHPAISHVRFGLGIPDSDGNYQYQTLNEFTFDDDTNSTHFNWRIPSPFFLPQSGVRIWIEANDVTGSSARAHGALSNVTIESGTVATVNAAIGLVTSQQTLAPQGTLPPGISHRPIDPSTGLLVPIGIAIEVPDGAREFKAYKRVNGGPLIFFAQGTEIGAPGSIEEISDDTFTPFGAEVCYFIQWFDTHGNPSPLAALGCVPVAAKTALPVPLLQRPQPGGAPGAETVVLRWFCPPDGIDRFRVYVGDGADPIREEESTGSARIGASTSRSTWSAIPLLPNPSPTPVAPLPGVLLGNVQYIPLDTERIAAGFGNPFSPGQFEIELPVIPGREYQFFVVAVSAFGDESNHSNIEPFVWSELPPVPPAEVPWPARAIGAYDPNFLPFVTAKVINEAPRFQGVGIRIGNFFGDVPAINFGGAYFADGILFSAPTAYSTKQGNSSIRLYTTASGESIFPCVLYRQQIDPDTMEPVSGDLVQVSPLIEDLLEREEAGTSVIHNPFVDLYLDGVMPALFIKDTQPVVLGNTYQYFVVRFKPNGEIDRVKPLPPITVPFNP